MTPFDVRHSIERLARGEHLGPNELRNLAHAAACGSIVTHLARTNVPLAAEMRHIESVARSHLKDLNYAP